MKRTIMVVMLLVSFIFMSTVFAYAKELAIENNGFESTAGSREGEVFFGWNPYYGGETNATIVTEKTAEGTRSLKLVGIEDEYVGVRSVRFPIEPGKEYSISLQTFIEDVEEPAYFEVHLEFWPVGYSGISVKMRLDHLRLRGKGTGSWRTMSGKIKAPIFADSASVFVFISNSQGTVYVDDIDVTQK